jgi:hypothetical protein
VELEMAERPHDLGARRAARVVHPPRQHPDPHPDDRLGQDVGVEAFPRLTASGRRPPARADAAGEPLEHPSRRLRPFAPRREHDAEELAMVVGEADEGLGLGLDDRPRIGPLVAAATRRSSSSLAA